MKDYKLVLKDNTQVARDHELVAKDNTQVDRDHKLVPKDRNLVLGDQFQTIKGSPKQ